MKKRKLLYRCLLLSLLLAGTTHFRLHAQTKTITGKITQEGTNAPLEGVTVDVAGAAGNTVSDKDGRYAIAAGPAAVLVFTYVGMDTVRISAGAAATVDVIMKLSKSAMDEVVVVGYGTMRKRDLTGSVSTIKTAKLEIENPRNIQELMRGNVSGLNIGLTTSAKGGGSIEIRGRRTLKASTDPLIVLDGVIYNGDLADINPTDIESMDVLKDASSAAVFGAKSANGVIIINTRLGRTEKPRVGVNITRGIVDLFRSEDVYGPYEFIKWRSDVLKSGNRTAPGYVFEDPNQLPAGVTLADWRAFDNAQGDPTDVWLRRLGMSQVERENYVKGQSTDWKDMVFRTGSQQSYNANLSGKSNRVNYYWSVGHDKNEGAVVGDDYSVYRSRLRLNANVTDFLMVGVNSMFSVRDESGAPVAWGQYDGISPWGQPTNPDGTYKIYPIDDAVANRHPLIDRYYTERSYTYKSLDNTLFAKLSLPLGISYEVYYSPRFTNNELYLHNMSQHPEYKVQGGIAIRNTSSGFNWQVDNLLKWSRTISNVHQFDVTLLANAEKYRTWQQSMDGRGFVPSDVLGYHDMGAATVTKLTSSDTYSTGDAYMARLFYAFKSRYMITGTVRRDGYSAFGINNPRATFPSVALGYVFSDEPFMKTSWLSYGKLRVSWGETGNRSVGIYDALPTLANGLITYVDGSGNPYQESYLYPNAMGNEFLQWERTRSLNVGVDFSLFNQRISGSLEGYSMMTNNLLVNRALPSVTGYVSVPSNLGQVNNKGFELSLQSRNIIKDHFSWNTTFNFSLNRNKIVALYGNKMNILDAEGNVVGQREADDLLNKWFIGHAIDAIWGFKVAGVWQQGEEAEAAKYKLAPGDMKLEDVNKDYAFTNDDKQFQGYTEPRFRFTLRNEFQLFKNIDFSFSAYSYWGHKRLFNEAKHSYSITLERYNSFTIPYWTPEHPRNDFARLNSNVGGVTFDVWQDISFIRLDNISIGYTVPKKLLERAKLSQLRFNVSARNVAVFTKNYVFWDPEYIGPTPSYVTVGLNLSL
ncbi:MAG: SusC/RagA family TonB-linked outer membrane protein [Niabella sp.]|nr:SusC/RagA family TonB-linked outer membrane protein [Niabella sp.]